MWHLGLIQYYLCRNDLTKQIISICYSQIYEAYAPAMFVLLGSQQKLKFMIRIIFLTFEILLFYFQACREEGGENNSSIICQRGVYNLFAFTNDLNVSG